MMRAAYAIGPLGDRITLADLPASSPRRWIPLLKAQVVAAVEGGLLSAEEACKRYALDAGELADWRRYVAAAGVLGLRVTQTQKYRDLLARRQRFE